MILCVPSQPSTKSSGNALRFRPGSDPLAPIITVRRAHSRGHPAPSIRFGDIPELLKYRLINRGKVLRLIQSENIEELKKLLLINWTIATSDL